MKIKIYVREKYFEALNYFITNKVSKPHSIHWQCEQYDIDIYEYYGVIIDYDDYVRLVEWKK